MKHYRAPWSRLLVIVSCVASLLCLGAAMIVMTRTHGLVRWAALGPLGMVVGSALFTIRGYTVTADSILVKRLFWDTRVPVADLQSVHFEPEVMRRSIRTFGNGGLFSFSGFYWNKHLGRYRAFVTDLRLTVVLRLPKRTVVISPETPEKFVKEFGPCKRMA
jgi:hypothetical protein